MSWYIHYKAEVKSKARFLVPPKDAEGRIYWTFDIQKARVFRWKGHAKKVLRDVHADGFRPAEIVSDQQAIQLLIEDRCAGT